MSVLPVQWHAVVLGLFSSIIAPFGGFFASGFKRAFKNKMVMGRVCVYIPPVVYRISKRIDEAIMDHILMNLTFEEQRALFMKIKQIIQERQFGKS